MAMAGPLVGLVLVLILIGRKAPRSGLEQLGWKSSRDVMERCEALEAEDIGQMVAARNARRRSKGLPERTRQDVRREFGAGPDQGVLRGWRAV